MLVIAPKRVCELTWPGEIEKWVDFNHFKWVFLHGPNKDALLDEDADIFLINPEGIEWLLTEEVVRKDADGDPVLDRRSNLAKLRQLGIDVLVVDESTKFKNPSSQRSKWLGYALGKFGRRWILTGTPAPRGYIDLFYQMYICDQGATLGSHVTHFRKEYFVTVNKEYHQYELAKGSAEKIQKAIKPHADRLDAEDFLDLPELIPNEIVVQLPTKARKFYDDMEIELIAELEGKSFSAVSQSTAMQKCEQIASGELYKNIVERTRKSASVLIHDEKIDALIDLMEQRQGKPTMILHWFQHEAVRIAKALKRAGIGPGVSFADMQGRKLREAEHKWNTDQFAFLLANPGTVPGLNLQGGACDALVWYTLPYDLELYIQTWRRLVRSGSKHKHVVNHRITAQNTIDEVKWGMLGAKDKAQFKFLNAIKTYRSSK
jgi:hypothetical protein